jgi:hypothetical protein
LHLVGDLFESATIVSTVRYAFCGANGMRIAATANSGCYSKRFPQQSRDVRSGKEGGGGDYFQLKDLKPRNHLENNSQRKDDMTVDLSHFNRIGTDMKHLLQRKKVCVLSHRSTYLCV